MNMALAKKLPRAGAWLAGAALAAGLAVYGGDSASASDPLQKYREQTWTNVERGDAVIGVMRLALAFCGNLLRGNDEKI
jgi:hypothetical protein